LNHGDTKTTTFKERLMRSLLTKSVLALFALSLPAAAEVAEVKIARQYGLGFLPLMVMEHEGFFEKEAKALGIDAKANWATLGNPSAINDALLSGNVDFVTNGPPAFLTMWAKTRGTPQEVMGVSSMITLAMFLVTRNPEVQTLKDFTEKDRIADTAVKVSIPAILMQMMAAKEFGPANYQKYDPLTVSLPHPDAMAALLNPKSEITAHFASPPFQQDELKQPGIRKVLTTEDVMGGPSTFSMVMAPTKFRRENPKAYQAFFRGFADAVSFINEKKPEAARIFIDLSKDKRSTVEEIVGLLNDPTIQFTQVPLKTMQYAEFMNQVGSIKVKPATWKDLFFPEVHDMPGS
jgi:NitT/TauT family transport system substrate-binding protein